MKTFRFKFRALLDYRLHRRNLCREYLAQILASDRELIRRRCAIEDQQQHLMRELKQLGAAGGVDIDRAASRRYYAGQLTLAVKNVESNRELVAQQEKICRQALLKADQEVKVLEKLRDRQRAEYHYHRDRREGLELDDLWAAGHRREYAK